jgi:hypothetical protein
LVSLLWTAELRHVTQRKTLCRRKKAGISFLNYTAGRAHHDFRAIAFSSERFGASPSQLQSASCGDFGFDGSKSACLKPKVKWFMSITRASLSQKAERLNRARNLLVKGKPASGAVHRLAQECSLSQRQAHRYLQQAKKLKDPVPVREGTTTFTVKIPHRVLERVRAYAATKRLPISEVVRQALIMQLPSETSTGAPGHERKPIVLDQIETLAAIGCTLEDIAGVIGISKRTLIRRQKEELIEEAIRRGRAKARVSLRRVLWNAAMRGNVKVAIILGKQMLGQRDRPVDNPNGGITAYVVETYPEGDPRAGKL